MNSIQLDSQQETAISLLESHRSVLLTGRAGTGKSFILQHWQSISEKHIVTLAPTGVAAINVNGQTIHSFFQFKPSNTIDEVIKKAKKISKTQRKLISKIDTIVIDEISMVRADLFDCIDAYLKNALDSSFPFASKQMVLIGDLFQLSPVVNREDKEVFETLYEGPYFFQANIFKSQNFNPEFIELHTVYRQKEDQNFLAILNAIRNKTIGKEMLKTINKNVVSNALEQKNDNAVLLTSTNQKVAQINQNKLDEINEPSEYFKSEVWGKLDVNAYPTDEIVELKKGARIMLIKNDRGGVKGRWINGTMGTVVEFKENKKLEGELEKSVIILKDVDQREVEVSTTEWEVSRYVIKKESISREVVGTFKQIPLRLAWAITVHKSQGKTFSNIIIDLSYGMFAHGQAYVALSRGTHLAGICLTHPLKLSDIKLDQSVVKFITQFQHKKAREKFSEDTIKKILKEAIEQKQKLQMSYLKGNSDVLSRVIEAKKIGNLTHKGVAFLALEAFCHQNNDIRVFNVNRILNLSIIKD